MWIPAWLWKPYSRLYSIFGDETFGFPDCRRSLSMDDLKTRVILSRLRRAGYLVVFEREGRIRRYRMLDASLLAFAEGAGVRNFIVPQGRYVKLILLWCKKLLSYYGERLNSVVLYGSAARGVATPSSDLDFLLIVDKLGRSYGSRIEELVQLEMDPELVKERFFLRQHGYSAPLSNLVYALEESRAFRLVYLDMIHEGLILFDPEDYFSRLAGQLKAQLRKLGTKKVTLDENRWYWVLKPDIRPGERLSL